MVRGVWLAIFFWRGGERAPPQPRAQAKTNKQKTEPEPNKATPSKKVEPAPEPEPEPDVEPPPSLLARTMSEWYLDGTEPKVRIDFKGLDPDESVKELKVIVWTGDVAAPKAASWRAPRVRPGPPGRQEGAVRGNE